ncbi:hypothetical protein FOXG_06920 [Fusarium oxysporum f. sp. lycopersici 4287]|uniref:Uncharacterized protein n=2 Tax=Fusarium oxysporum TaxID=5507 RepID=A0A0J9WM54_FUSO4|nr:hypothetical protein FOXG_06920 [Fusarium oxysporum f. sp. lycopersici 4287]KNB04937.1 hypothetical protein FOXG_06920 [Fusarium oxysporum f. sp. lycopersici 4287]
MAEETTDGRLFKAGLTASLGARPVKDISEYEDTDAELWGGGGEGGLRYVTPWVSPRLAT